MNLGAENKKQVRLLAVLGTVAVVALLWTFWPSSAPAPGSAPAAQTTRTSSTPRAVSTRRTSSGKVLKIASEPRLDPTLELDVLRQSEEIKYEGRGRNIFMAGSVPVETPQGDGTKKGDLKAHTPIPAPPVQPPPPITLKFYGFSSKPGEPKKIFLSQGEDIFIAGEGDIVDRRYRILRISPVSVEIEDVLYNNKQSIPLTQG